MDRRTIVQSGYDNIAAEYLRNRPLDGDDVRLLDDLERRLPRDAHVLDAGCGAGVPVARILSPFANVTGVDFSEAQLELARRLAPSARFLSMDMTRLGFAAGCFDAVVSYYAIIHIPREQHRAVLEDFFRILKPSGWLLLCTGAGDLEDDVDDDWLGTRMYWSHYDAETNLTLVRDCGFYIIWSRIISDPMDPGGGHLFILGQKP